MFYKSPSFTIFKQIFNYSLAYVMHSTTNLLQENLRKLGTKVDFTVG